ncbi:MAG TPA: CARDB domain-containing protein [Pirellulales bacterium]|nr:CARDB domain-containing protein [Pirellulales bacterium]
MTTCSKHFRTAIVAVSTVAFTLPQTVWAGGHGGGMGGGMSGASSGSFQNHTFHPPTINSSNLTSRVSNSNISPIQGAPTISKNAAPALGTISNPTSSSYKNLTTGFGPTIVSKNMMDEPGDPVAAGTAEGSLVVAGLGVATGGGVVVVAGLANAVSNGIDAIASLPSQASSNDPNQLTNGSGSQYQDGGPLGNPVKGAGTPSGNPNAGSAAGSAMAGSSSSTGSSASTSSSQTVLNSKIDIGKIPAGYGDKSTGLGTKKIPLADQTQTRIPRDKIPLSQQSSGNASSPATPTKPNPSSSGPLFGGGAGDSSGTDGTSSDSTTPASDTPSTSTAAAPDSSTTPATTSGIDLVLEDVTLAAPATLVAGPAYTVKFRNQGSADAGKFQVGIFAGFPGKLTADAPRAAVEVPSLAAGEVKQVTLRLPQKAMKLTGTDGKPTAFTRLFIGVDLNNSVIESDKSNNTAVVDRAALETTAAN